MTQVQLTHEEMKALRHLSAATGKSIAELIRNAIHQLLACHHIGQAEGRADRAIRVVGMFSSRYLAEAFER